MKRVQVSEELAVVIEYLKSNGYTSDLIMKYAYENKWDNTNFFGFNVEILNETDTELIKQVLDNNYDIDESTIRGVGRTVMFELSITENIDLRLGKKVDYNRKVIEIIAILSVTYCNSCAIITGVGRIL